jgi:hypothetical protein
MEKTLKMLNQQAAAETQVMRDAQKVKNVKLSKQSSLGKNILQ